MYFLDADDGSDDEETPDGQDDKDTVPPEKRLHLFFICLSSSKHIVSTSEHRNMKWLMFNSVMETWNENLGHVFSLLWFILIVTLGAYLAFLKCPL